MADFKSMKKCIGAPQWKPLAVALMLVFAPASAPLQAAPFDVAQVPLYLGGTIEPNLLYIHDNSGSMSFGFVPDGVGMDSSYNAINHKRRYAYSSHYNKLYYDPSVLYVPPVDKDGVSLGNASFTAAWLNGYAKTEGTRNLSSNFLHSWWYRWGTGIQDYRYSDTNAAYKSAYYFVFDTTLSGCNGVATNESCYRPVFVSATSGTGPAGADERTNFANWFSYYRTRNFAAKAGISRAFSSLGAGIRIGYGRIGNLGDVTVDGKVISSTIERGVRPFADFTSDAVYGNNKFRTQFYNWLFGLDSTSATPLRRALDAAGQYYENSSANGPWSTTPGVSGGETLSCRKSFTILMTDGYWNDAQASTAGARANNDGTAGSTITGPKGASYTYTPTSPFNDANTNTLADVAMYYWKRDLLTTSPGGDNRVPTTATNPAFWQHMVTYGVGFGVTGSINSTDAFAAISTGAPINWANSVGAPDGSPSKIDDLLHAAVNSRGGFYSAANPVQFAEALTNTLAKIRDETSSAAAVAASSTSLSSDTAVFQAKFDSSNWSSQFLAYKLCTQDDVDAHVLGCDELGAVKPTPAWDAATLIPSHASRSVFTWNPESSSGIPFLWANLNTTQKGLLDNQESKLNYLRGDTSQEAPAGSYRKREGKKLGDIVNSDPFYVGAGDFGYATAASLTDAQRTAYKTRKANSAFTDRTRMVYVGANDGMLHAFNAETGSEKFAYVPNAVFSNLKKLADPDYTHSYYVDGSPKAADALLGSSWKTVLVGSTGAGGRAYFALDVENPDSFNGSKVLWEFSHADLGYALGQASIVRTESGHWVAIFGNGYNSDNHTAQLFVVNLTTGALLKKIDTLSGTAADPNGLSTPLVIDTDFNGSADLVYAGDMQGNLWKFDLSGSSTASWKVAIGTTSEPKPLLKAKDGVGTSAKVQPITAKPQAVRHAPTGGVMVYVGTGQFFETGDQGNKDLQTFYGVLDKCGRNTSGSGCSSAGTEAKYTRSNLVQQSIEQEYVESFTNDAGVTTQWDIRVVSDNAIDYAVKDGFYMDLVPPTSVKEGERIITAPVVWEDRVIFVTMIPDTDPCNFGGTSWIMELDPFSGGRTPFSVFDLNRDKSYNDGDYAGDNVVSGRKTEGGMGKTPAVIGGKKYLSGSAGGAVEMVSQKEALDKGRQSWRQLR